MASWDGKMVIRQMERGAMGYIHFQTPISNIKGGLFHIFPPWCPKIIELDDGENLQDTPIFDGKNHGFRLRFSRLNQSMEKKTAVMPLLFALFTCWWGDDGDHPDPAGAGRLMLTWLGYIDGKRWDPWSTIYSSTMDPSWVLLLLGDWNHGILWLSIQLGMS